MIRVGGVSWLLPLLVPIAFAWLWSCDDRGAVPDKQGPAPALSVAAISVGIGTCADLRACEDECDAGSADRCRRLAATYALGSGVEKDEGRATALYEHACDMNEPSACVFAGQMHEYAHGVPKDDAIAARLYQRSCGLGWAAGCYNAAIMFEAGRGVPRDSARAADLYRVSCAAGAKPGCDKVKALEARPLAPSSSSSPGGALP